MSKFWTPAQDEMLRRLWNAGKTAAQIAGELRWGKSRNAVIGRASRLGLASRESPIGKGFYPTRERVSDQSARRPCLKRKLRIETPKPRPVPIVTRPGTECRWTDSTQAPWVFCDQPCQAGFSWCPEHKARVFQKKAAAE